MSEKKTVCHRNKVLGELGKLWLQVTDPAGQEQELAGRGLPGRGGRV